jgi:peptidoglycan/LPS O-acetylase OafA/YrhL
MKFRYLDGLRGLAAFVVLLDHFTFIFLPTAVNGLGESHLGQLIYRTPLYLGISGDFAVCIFFVLSGIVLSAKFFRTGNESAVIATATKRYFRLAIPIFGSIMLAYALLKLGLIFNHQAGQLSNSPWWSAFWSFPLNGLDALYEASMGALTAGAVEYNPPLWTMQLEFFGSFLVFILLLVFGKLRNRWLVYGLLALGFWHTYYLAFILGVITCDYYFNDKAQAIQRFLSRGGWIPLLLVSLGLGSWPVGPTEHTLFAGVPEQLRVLGHVVGAFGLIAVIIALRPLQRLLELKPIQFMGRISFSLYLMHFLVLGSYTSYLFTNLPTTMSFGFRVLITFIPTVIVTIAVAYLYAKFVDESAIRLSGVIHQRLFAKVEPATQSTSATSSTKASRPGLPDMVKSYLAILARRVP